MLRLEPRPVRRSLPAVLGLVLLTSRGAPGQPARAADWPMWGGAPSRNMVSAAKGLPESWDVQTGRNVLWRAELGSESYGNPVVAGGRIFVGTNNARPRNPAVQGDRGILMAFRAADGTFLWQAVTEKLSSDRDWPLVGICSSPVVDGDRLFYLTNRGELVALSPMDASVVWKLDLAKDLGVVARFQTAGSPTVLGDLLFVNTANGNASGGKVPSPKAPSFLAVDKRTGKVAWSSSSPGAGLLDGQWSSPAVGVIGGVTQAVFGGGDGWLYGLAAATGKVLWKLDANASLPKPAGSSAPAARGFFVATPVLSGNAVYIGLGQDPQEGAAAGMFFAVDATQRGDITRSGVLWSSPDVSRTLSTVAISEGLLYLADFAGHLRCLDARTGKLVWVYDATAAIWGSPLVADGKVYLGTEDGDVLVFKAGRELKLLSRIQMGHALYSTPVPAGGVLYIATSHELFAIGERPPKQP